MRLLGFSALAALSFLSTSVPSGAAEEGALGRGVGDRVADFTLPDATTGQPVSLYDFRGNRAAVLVFTGIGCPIGDLYMPRLVDLAERYEAEGVVFLAINSNRGQDAEEIASQVEEFGLTFPVLRDEGNAVADQILAERTCEVLVLDAKALLRYRGAIDDQYGLGFAKDAAEHHYLADAIDAVLAGQSPETSASSVVGCPIERSTVRAEVDDLMALDVSDRVNRLIAATDRIRPPSEQIERAWDEVAPDEDALIDEVGPVTFAKDVAPIVRSKCEACHRPGEVGPFPLTNFDEVRRRAFGIQEVVDLRRMPPWHADPRFPADGHFANDRSLSPQERATVLAWIEQGTPEGDPDDLPPAADWPDGWVVGTPDIVIPMPKPYVVKAEGFERYQHFSVPLDFKEDVWVQVAEARPSDRSVVHHIIAYIIPPGGEDEGEGRRKDRDRIHLCGYAPGEMPTVYPPGTAKKIPAGSSLLFELHYTPIGEVRIDQSRLGLTLAKGPITREGVTLGIANAAFEIPPGDGEFPVRSQFIFPRDASLIGFMPHMHLRGKAFRYDATFADGTSETLLDVPAFDFNWQSYYYLDEPIPFRAGERLDCLAHFDNSPANSVNPDPSSAVRWGAQTWEEMMIGYVDVSFPLDPEERPEIDGSEAITAAE